MRHVYFYLDESGPFDDQNRGESWPVSVVAGLIADHELDSDSVKPVLNSICAYGHHDLLHKDLHALELRDRLGDKYADWMTNAIASASKLGKDVRAVCFRNSEQYAIGDVDTTYLTVMVEGLSQLIPRLMDERPDENFHVTVCLENRRIMREAAGVMPSGRRSRRDRDVTRKYVPLEDYRARIATRLRIEMIRANRLGAFNVRENLTLILSDPSQEKALNFADFISHHCRFRERGGDNLIYKNALEPLIKYDLPVIFNLTYEAAARFASEQRWGEALFAITTLMREETGSLQKSSTQAATEQLHRTILASLWMASPQAIHLAVNDFLERTDNLPSDERGLYLRELLRWCESGMHTGAKSKGTIVIRARERARDEAFRWGAFRAHKAFLVHSLLRGDLVDAREHRIACQPLLTVFGRSVEHQPHVLDFLAIAARMEGLACDFEAARTHLDALFRFHRDTEEWWSTDLPTVLPELGQLKHEDIRSQPLGRVMRIRGVLRARNAWHRRARGETGSAIDTEIETARKDLIDGLDEVTAPDEVFLIGLQLAQLESRVGRVPEACQALWRAIGVIEGPRTLEARASKKLIDALMGGPDPTVALATLLQVVLVGQGVDVPFTFADQQPTGAAKSLSDELSAALLKRKAELLAITADDATPRLTAIGVELVRARWLETLGEDGLAREALDRVISSSLYNDDGLNAYAPLVVAARLHLAEMLAPTGKSQLKRAKAVLDAAVDALGTLTRDAGAHGFPLLAKQYGDVESQLRELAGTITSTKKWTADQLSRARELQRELTIW